ncbi:MULTISPECIES: CaiB/BaiF CoA-transferase family protein [unclassified Frankia]|uniref:CaiB/BaiF CoA transferase family protein n=1 Tax=unclassified Frankia TaxID=2632575 RepID=UPI002AD5738C|nr:MULTISPECIES: CaiB/BaiF CoA-transferase family protein [unclassified Frankia]
MTGPLAGVRVLEMAGLGPAPFGAMLLADMGADVVRVDRLRRATAGGDYEKSRQAADPRRYAMDRGRRSVALDLKNPAGIETLLTLLATADVLVEGFRPGVMERLGLGPEVCLARNPRLVYARMTGWGQDGPLAHTAGHDITYIALAGALNNFRRHGERPVPPLSLVGDFGGGGMLLAFGVVCALLEARASGHGQVVDAAMVDGTALLTTLFHGLLAQGRWRDEPGTNFADTGAPYYEVYETADGRYVAVGALEGPFYNELINLLGLSADELPSRDDPTHWPALKERFAAVFRTRTRDEWADLLLATDSCVAPVLSFTEAPRHPHLAERGTFIERDGVMQPAPAPRFSRTPAELGAVPPLPGEQTSEVLTGWGFTPEEVAKLVDAGVVGGTAAG